MATCSFSGEMRNAECKMLNEGVRSADKLKFSEGNTSILHLTFCIQHSGVCLIPSQNNRLDPSPAFFVSFPFSTKPIFSSQRWNSGMAVFPVISRKAAVSRKPVVW